MIIELRSVWFRYRDSGRWVLRDISTEFRSGRLTAVVGPNGSGKTTLMKIGSLLYRPCRGSVVVDGVEFWGLEPGARLSIRRKVVYLHEKPIMLRGTVLDNVVYGLRLRGFDRDRAIDRAIEILQKLDLEDLAYRDARKLSTGQAQLVAIARALVIEPEIAFLDEPLAHLDKVKRELVIELITQLRSRGVGFVISTHSEILIENLEVDNVIVLKPFE